MKVQILKSKLPANFIIIALVICGVIFTLENINGRFWLNDFKVYYLAAKALLDGETVYGVSFGLSSGLYKYSPFTLFLFLPYTLFPYKIASILHFAIISSAATGSIVITFKLLEKYIFFGNKVKENLLMTIVFICTINHIIRDLHLGNVNLILLFFTTLAIHFMIKGKDIIAGGLFAVVLITKPYFLILILPLIIYKQRKILLSLAISILIFISIPMLFLGFTKNIELHKEWIRELMAHNTAMESSQTIISLFRYYFFQNLPDYFTLIFIALAGMLYILYAWIKNRYYTKEDEITSHQQKANLIIDCFILLAIIPNLVITDIQHFLWSIPIIAILLFYVSIKKKYLLIVGFIVVIILYGGNSTDLLGHSLSKQLLNMGILGISNLVLIVAVIILSLKREIPLGTTIIKD